MSKRISRRDYSAELIYTCVLFEQIESHYCPDSLEKWYAHINGLSAIMMLYSPKKGDSPIMAIIYGQHQKFRVICRVLLLLSIAQT
ncbi:hypothetical protein N7509_012783 [Penicillium cosmopolitanum]|uniref:Uncharacterized protein n=1 Tax=Penicillium cosmopolitanum TaxID=1131564 RepID=A0A9W9VBI1_9EURO|nr:uncharacterized protein N7509_012783 [Penicillium cosmopolitanum]KAJ5375897.1 hypothetical protein N7509_012783 [Penicillium cosmopolitanum]